MQRLIFIPLILSIFLSGCFMPARENQSQVEPPTPRKGNDVENGVYKKYRDDGKLFSEIPMKNGKRNGLAKDYYPDGTLHHEIEYVNGLKHGAARTYYENGQLYMHSTYSAGKLDGVQKKYRDNGLLMAEIPYKMGQPGIGLKEYLRDGKEKTNFAKLIIEPVDKIQSENIYELKLYFDKRGKKAPDFYIGELTDGQYLPNEPGIIPRQGHSALLELELPPSTYINHEFNIISVFYTRLGNPYVVQRSYKVDIRNTKSGN